MKRVLHALAALWLGRPKTGDRSWKTEEDRSWKTGEERSWKTEEQRRDHEGPWLPEARNGLLQHLTAMMRMGETVRELAIRECAKEQPSESANVQTNESAPKKTDDHLPKRVIVSEREQPAERIGEPLPIAQVLARLYLRHAPRCAMGDTGAKDGRAKQPGSASSDSHKPNSQPLSLAPRRAVPLALGVLALFMCLLSAQQVSAQAEPAAAAVIQPLQIGDTIPEELWHLPLQVVNHPEGKETITLNDYRGKLIILDFWATWCAPCITSLHKLDDLQVQFSDDLAVIPTTYEQPEKVAPFFADKGWALPTATMETTLKEYFPYQSIPHQVWVKDGKLLAVAGHEYANEQYINRVVQGERVDFTHKIEVPFDKSKPLFLNGNGGDGSNMLYQSVISGRMDARVAGVARPGSNQILLYNQTVEQLFIAAVQSQGIGHLNVLNAKRYIKYEVDDSLRYLINPEMALSSGDSSVINQWANDNLYCYNLVLPKEAHRSLFSERILKDLNDFFGLHLNIEVSYEDRKLNALAIIKTDSYSSILTKGGERVVRIDKEENRLTLRNRPLSSLVGILGGYLNRLTNNKLERYPLPIVDETEIEGNVDLTLSADLRDIDSIRIALNKSGLDIVEKKSIVKMIVFKHNPKPFQ